MSPAIAAARIHEERDRDKADARLKEIDEILADHAEGRGPQIERDTLDHAQHGNGRDHRIDADIANQSTVGQPDDDANREADQGAEKDESGVHVLGHEKGTDDDGQAYDRADRNVETSHHQHIELRHGHQRQGRSGEQNMPDVERREEHVRAQ